MTPEERAREIAEAWRDTDCPEGRERCSVDVVCVDDLATRIAAALVAERAAAIEEAAKESERASSATAKALMSEMDGRKGLTRELDRDIKEELEAELGYIVARCVAGPIRALAQPRAVGEEP